MMKRSLTIAVKLVAVLLLALVAIHPLFGPTLPWSDDGQLHFWRVVELDHCLRNGYFYPRWMPDMAYGYGYPLLNYYAPLSVYLAEGFHLLGLDFTAALLAATSASLILGTLGTYLWARDALGEAGGLIAAAAYTYAPYTLYNAIWRGNLAESLALGLLPWAFWRLRQLILRAGVGSTSPKESNRHLIAAASVLAMLVLSHNITALIAFPLLFGYALLLWHATGRSRRALGLVAGALALALTLAAFFWAPAFFERDYVQTEKMITAAHFDYRHNFLRADELLSPPVPADVTLMNPPVPRSLGWTALVLAALGVAGSWRAGTLIRGKCDTWPYSLRWEILGIFAGLVLCAFLTLPVSRFLWDSVPLLPYVGFPWRFLGPAGLAAAWLAGASALWGRKWRVDARSLAIGLATLALVAFSLTWLYPRYLEPMENTTPTGLIAFERESGALGTTSVGEYLPISVVELPDTTALEVQYQTGGAIQRLAPESLPEEGTIVAEQWRLIGGDVTVISPHDWTATLLLFRFPGWRVWLNGTEVATTPSEPHGLVRFPVPAGETRIRVRFGLTPWRLAGTVLSAVGLLALAALAFGAGARPALSHVEGPTPALPPLLPIPSIPPSPPFHSPAPYYAALIAVGLIFAAKVIFLDTHDSPVRYTGFDGQAVIGVDVPAQIKFDKGARLLGHDPARLIAESGGTLSLRLYWAADGPIDKEYSSFLHLVDAQGHRWGQSDNQHPGGYPTVRWRTGEYNRDDHALMVLPGTPPGTYALRAGLLSQSTGVGLDVLDERGAPAGTSATIGTVTVTRPQRPPSIEALDMAYPRQVRDLPGVKSKGPAPLSVGDLTLLGMGLDRHHAAPGEALLLKLYWRAEQKMGQDYSVLLKVTDRSEKAVTQVALSPATSAYPTSQWIPGEILSGQHWLILPANLNSGTYGLSLQLLDASGTARGSPIALGEAGLINVIAPERQMTIPPMEFRLDTNFGDRITLLGYDLEPEVIRPGEKVLLTLYWRAKQSMQHSYAVFAHLLDANSHIVAQHDGLPANWTRPTTGWLPGEVVVDIHSLALEIDILPGEYPLEVGLYDAESHVRLPVLNAIGQAVADRMLLAPLSVEP